MGQNKVYSEKIKLADVKFRTEWFWYHNHLWRVVDVNDFVYGQVYCTNKYNKDISLDINTIVEVYRPKEK